MNRPALQAPLPPGITEPGRRRYNSLAAHLRERLGGAARKVVLDAGSTCPNRDGTVGLGGCAFCDPRGSGTGRGQLSLAEQWRAVPARSGQARLAYLQSFSNTHGPTSRLQRLLADLLALPGLGGICLGTRPDCLDDAKLDLLAQAAAQVPAFWLELGLQSARDATLQHINRGHGFAVFAWAVQAAGARGIPVCAHLMAGLPGEEPDDFLASVDAVAALPVAGIKLHNLLVVRGTAMERLWRGGAYRPMGRQQYVAAVVAALERTRPDMVIHRLQADARPGELLAPDWAADKAGLLADIRAELEKRDTWQGKVWRREEVNVVDGQGTPI